MYRDGSGNFGFLGNNASGLSELSGIIHILCKLTRNPESEC